MRETDNELFETFLLSSSPENGRNSTMFAHHDWTRIERECHVSDEEKRTYLQDL